jgi:hypothetical protein
MSALDVVEEPMKKPATSWRPTRGVGSLKEELALFF